MPSTVGSTRPALLAALACLLLAACSGPTEPPANTPPRARIDGPADPLTLPSTDTLRLSGSATDDEDGDLDGAALAWSSDVDGDLGTGPDLEAWGLALGDHWVTLTATDSDGDTGADSLRVTVENAPPVAMITAPSRDTTMTAGDSVAFEGAAEDPEDGALTGDALAWTSDLDGELGTGESVSTDALSEGEHVITLTATDAAGATDEATVTVTVSNTGEPPTEPPPPEEPPANQPPTAEITAPADGATFEEGADVTFEGSASDPEDGAISGASLVWTSDVDGELGTGESVTTGSLSVGEHVITLRATDSDGTTGKASVTLAVESAPEPPTDRAPTVTIRAPADRTAFDEGTTVTFEGTATDPEDGPLTAANLVWTSDTEGHLGTGEMLSIASLAAGPHTVTLTATDSDGNTASASVDLVMEAFEVTIRLHYQSEFTPSQKAALEAGVARWEKALVVDLPAHFPASEEATACQIEEEGIDDLVVSVSIALLGGSSPAATGGPCLVRMDEHGRTTTTISGRVTFNRDHLAALSDESLAGLMAHEVGHALGIGSSLMHGWSSRVGGTPEDRYFAGETAWEIFYIWYLGDTYLGHPVPLDRSGLHWRRRNFSFEVMSALQVGFTPLSAVSIAALADIGYVVDLQAADDYSLPMPQFAVFPVTADATLSHPSSAADNFGLPDGSTLSETVVAGANDGLWSPDPDGEQLTGLLQIPSYQGSPEVIVTQAELVLEVRDRNVSSPGQEIEIRHVTEDWSEGAVTWDTRPDLGGQPVLTFEHDGCTSCRLTSDALVTLAEKWSNGNYNESLAVLAPGAAANPTFSVGFWSRHASDRGLRPRLEVGAINEDLVTGLRALEVADADVVIPVDGDVLPGPIYAVDPTGTVRRIDGHP